MESVAAYFLSASIYRRLNFALLYCTESGRTLTFGHSFTALCSLSHILQYKKEVEELFRVFYEGDLRIDEKEGIV